MSEDVPLTAFESDDGSGNADGSGKDDDRDEEDGAPSKRAETADDPAESEPAATPSLTYTSSPAGAPCAACGETVEKRWRAGEGGVSGEGESRGVDDPDALVCPDCKEW